MSRIHERISAIFVMVISILLSGHYLSTVVPSIRSYICILLILFVIIPVFLKYNRQLFLLQSSSDKIVAILGVIAIISMIVNFEVKRWFSYLIYITTILFALYITKRYSFVKFRQVFQNIVVIIALISLIVFGLNFIGTKVILSSVDSMNGVSYANGYLVTFNTSEYAFFRNFGCFWEPGLFASILIYALILECFNEKMSYLRIFLYVITVVTTFSAAGYVLLLPVLLFILLKKKESKLSNIVQFISIILVLLILFFSNNILTFLTQAVPIVGDKLFSGNELLISTSRIDSVFKNLDIFFKNPLFGKGCYGINEAYSSQIAQTSTFAGMLATFGVGGIFYTIAWVCAIFKCDITGIGGRICLFIIMVSILNKEPHTYILISWVLLFYLLDYSEMKQEYVGNVDT